MSLKLKISEIEERRGYKPAFDTTFIYPYSTDKIKRRDEIWSNLQKGLLLEDKQIMIPWELPHHQLYKYEEKRQYREGLVFWNFGKHKILDGYESDLYTLSGIYSPWSNPLSMIAEDIGIDSTGNRNFLELKELFTELLGEPTNVKLEKKDSFDIGFINWINGRIEISLSSYKERFSCSYSYNLNIGFIIDRRPTGAHLEDCCYIPYRKKKFFGFIKLKKNR